MPEADTIVIDPPPPRGQDLMRNRVIGAAVALPCLVVLVLAAWVTPNPEGLGTHQQLGLMPCGFSQRRAFHAPRAG